MPWSYSVLLSFHIRGLNYRKLPENQIYGDQLLKERKIIDLFEQEIALELQK